MKRETRLKFSIAAKKRWENPEYREKMSKAVKRLWKDPAFREKLQKGGIGKYPRSHATREKQRKAMTGHDVTPETRNKISKGHLRYRANIRKMLKEREELLGKLDKKDGRND